MQIITAPSKTENRISLCPRKQCQSCLSNMSAEITVTGRPTVRQQQSNITCQLKIYWSHIGILFFYRIEWNNLHFSCCHRPPCSKSLFNMALRALSTACCCVIWPNLFLMGLCLSYPSCISLSFRSDLFLWPEATWTSKITSLKSHLNMGCHWSLDYISISGRPIMWTGYISTFKTPLRVNNFWIRRKCEIVPFSWKDGSVIWVTYIWI